MGRAGVVNAGIEYSVTCGTRGMTDAIVRERLTKRSISAIPQGEPGEGSPFVGSDGWMNEWAALAAP